MNAKALDLERLRAQLKLWDAEIARAERALTQPFCDGSQDKPFCDGSHNDLPDDFF